MLDTVALRGCSEKRKLAQKAKIRVAETVRVEEATRRKNAEYSGGTDRYKAGGKRERQHKRLQLRDGKIIR